MKATLRRLPLPACHLDDAEVRVAAAPIRGELDGFFELGDGGVQILEPGERVREQYLRVDVAWLNSQRLVRPHLGIVEPARHQQDVPGANLDVDASGQKIGGANEFAGCQPPLAGLGVGLAQLEPKVSVLWEGLQGVPVFEDSFGPLALGRVLVAAGDVGFGVLAARSCPDTEQSQAKYQAALRPWKREKAEEHQRGVSKLPSAAASSSADPANRYK